MNRPLTAENTNGLHKHKKMVSLAPHEGNAKKNNTELSVSLKRVPQMRGLKGHAAFGIVSPSWTG